MDTRTENNDVRPARLLVVDDEDLLGRTLCTYFTAKGHEVVTCTSGQEALARPDLQGFDLLITDLQLPQMDGIEVITRALAAQPDMAAILMTGHASVDSAVQALRHGAVDYVQKPFSFKALEAVVERALQMQRLKQANRLLSLTSQYPIKTITAMVRAYNGPFIRNLSLKAMGPEINTEIMYKAQIMRARVAEIPAHLDWSDQAERMAKRKVSLRVSTTSKLLVFASFLYRPIAFFLIPGVLLLDQEGRSRAWAVPDELLGEAALAILRDALGVRYRRAARATPQ